MTDQLKLEKSRSAGYPGEQSQEDLNREAANMQELLSRQPALATPLSICSKQAQAVLRQF